MNDYTIEDLRNGHVGLKFIKKMPSFEKVKILNQLFPDDNFIYLADDKVCRDIVLFHLIDSLQFRDHDYFMQMLPIKETIYTCKDLSEGRVACEHDSSVEDLTKVLKYCINKLCKPRGDSKYYSKGLFGGFAAEEQTSLPTQSVKVFLKEIEIEEVRLKAAQGVKIEEEKKELYFDENGLMYGKKSKLNDFMTPKETFFTDAVNPPKEIKVGDYVRGFNINHVGLNISDKYINQIAKVIEVSSNSTILVEFSDGYTWHYVYSQAIEHLVDIDIVGKDWGKIENTDESYPQDNINPSHYKKLPKETIERIQDNLTPEEFKGYIKGNILKYIDRYENKNGVEDLKKANWYLEKLISIQ